MPLVSHFPYLSSNDTSPSGVWSWAKRLVDALNRWKLFNLIDVPLSDKPRYVLRINENGNDFEFSKPLLDSLEGVVLVGKTGWIIRVNPTEDGFELDTEVMESLRGADLTGKANYYVKVNATADGFTLSAT